MSTCRAVALLVAVLVLHGPATAEDLPYPAGQSTTHEIEGLKTILHLPPTLSKEAPASLVIILHGAGGTATGMAGALRDWPEQGYVVCAPKSVGQTWAESDLRAVLRIGSHLKAVLPIDPKRVHVVGFSNGGWNLHPLAFDDGLHPCSATWVAAGFRGGGVPKWAKKELGALALAGAQDANLSAARATVPALRDKARSVEVRVQPGLGHEWPDQLMPYLRWWMGAMEGRFVPGDDLNFEWGGSIEEAVAALEGQKKGGVFVYVHDAADAEKPEARALQNEVFMDPLVRHYGNQLEAVKLDRAEHNEAVTALGVKETPAVVVLKKDGKVKKVLSGKLKASKLASALKSVAPNKRKPE